MQEKKKEKVMVNTAICYVQEILDWQIRYVYFMAFLIVESWDILE